MKPAMTVLFAMFLAVTAAVGALAHSFDVTMLVPDGAREQARTAFLVASAERDAHAGAESDGHLGGLDVYVTLLEADRTEATAGGAADVVVDLRGGGAGTGDAWLLSLPAVPARAAAEFLVGFDDRYRRIAGSAPDDVARRAYVAARLIDIAVRAQGGVEDKAALRRAIQGY